MRRALLVALLLTGCDVKPKDTLDPDVESYAVEFTPAVFRRYQDGLARHDRICEGERVLAAELKKVGKAASSDELMVSMQAAKKEIRSELDSLRNFIQNAYLEQKKYQAALTSEGLPMTQPATAP